MPEPTRKPAPAVANSVSADTGDASSPAGPTRQAANPTAPSPALDTFTNPNPERDYLIRIEVPEFTCLCPLTGQPDFATIEIDYIADQLNIELKGLKLYMWSYRDQGAFHEACTNQILTDLVTACQPRFMRVTARWYVRGGIFTTVLAEHIARGFEPPRIADRSDRAVGGAPAARSFR